LQFACSQEVTAENLDVKGSTGTEEHETVRARLRGLEPAQRIEGRNWTKADILLYREGAFRCAIKDYAARPFLVRQTLGRFLIRREAAAYRAAAGLAGLPRFHGRVGPFSLATEWLEAEPLAKLPRDAVGPEVFDRLEHIVGRLHDRGIALGDLHHRDVLVAADGSVHVIDLATAWILGRRPWGMRRLLFERFRDQDRVALARLRARFRGENEEAAIDAVGGRAAAWHRRGRRARALWDRVRGRRRAG